MSNNFTPEWNKERSHLELMRARAIGICRRELWQKIVEHALYYGIATEDDFKLPEREELPKPCPEMEKALQELDKVNLEQGGLILYMQKLHAFIKARADCYGLQ